MNMVVDIALYSKWMSVRRMLFKHLTRDLQFGIVKSRLGFISD